MLNLQKANTLMHTSYFKNLYSCTYAQPSLAEAKLASFSGALFNLCLNAGQKQNEVFQAEMAALLFPEMNSLYLLQFSQTWYSCEDIADRLW